MKKELFVLVVLLLFNCKNEKNVQTEFIDRVNQKLKKENAYIINEPYKINMSFTMGKGPKETYSNQSGLEQSKYFNTLEILYIIEENPKYYNEMSYDMTKVNRAKSDEYINLIKNKIPLSDSISMTEKGKKIYQFSQMLRDYRNDEFYMVKYRTNENEYGYLFYFTNSKKMIDIKY